MAEQSEMMLAELIRYNNWANQEVIDACAKLDATQLDTIIPGAYGTIRETLIHIIRAESGYIRLMTGQRPMPSFDWEQQPTIAQIKEYAVELGQVLESMAQAPALSNPIYEQFQGKPLNYTNINVYIQLINHGIEHRTNITTILNQGALETPDVDGWGYLVAHRDRFEPK